MTSGSWLDRGGMFCFISGSLVVVLSVTFFPIGAIHVLISILTGYLDSLYHSIV